MRAKEGDILESNLVEADEVGLLDLLILIAENIKLLIVGSLIAGVIGAGLAHLAPTNYVSQAILAIPAPLAPGQRQGHMGIKVQSPAQAATMMVSPQVLDPVIQQFKLAVEGSVEGARQQLRSQVEVVVSMDGLLSLDVHATAPTQAQALANAIIDNWIGSTTPTQQERAELEKILIQAEKSLESTRVLVEQLASESRESLAKPLSRGEAGATIVSLGELHARNLDQVLEASRLLRGATRDVVKQPPTLPTSPKSAPKGLFALLSAMAAAMMLLLWIFIVQAWRNAAQDPRVAPKLLRLRAALRLK